MTSRPRTRQITDKMTAEGERQGYLAIARSQAIAPKVLSQVEEVFRHPKEFLGGVENQQRYVATIHLEARECPWCDSAVSYFESVPETYEYKIGYGCTETRCPHCKKRIREIVPFMGSWFWAKHEEDKNPDRKKVGT